VKKGQYNFLDKEWNHVSNDAKAFIRKMLAVDVGARLTAVQAFRDPWIKNTARHRPVDTNLFVQAITNMQSFNA
jgi:serine/threonine protein kinase